VIKLTLDFYKRNYIEGLFLSSGIIRSPDYTMEQLVEVARALREDHGFRGYIHLKTIAEADPLLIEQASVKRNRGRAKPIAREDVIMPLNLPLVDSPRK